MVLTAPPVAGHVREDRSLLALDIGYNVVQRLVLPPRPRSCDHAQVH